MNEDGANRTAGFADKLLEAVLLHGEVRDILAFCKSVMGVGCAFFDLGNGTVDVDSDIAAFAEQCTFYPLAEVLRLYKHWKITSRGVSGYLVADNSYKDESSFAVFLSPIIRAILICKTQKRHPSVDTNDSSLLLKKLLHAPRGDVAALREHLAVKKLDYRSGFFVTATHVAARKADCRLPPELYADLFARHESVLRGAPLKLLWTIECNSFFTAIFCDDFEKTRYLLKNAATVSQNFLQSLKNARDFFIFTGVGGFGRDIADFAISGTQADMAIRHAVFERREAAIAHWSDVGVEQILARALPEGLGWHDMRAALEEMRLLQKAKKTPFFSTLVALVRNYWNMTATAEQLALHYNSLKYRYDKISQLLGVDMNSEKVRFELSIALRTYLYNLPAADFQETITF